MRPYLFALLILLSAPHAKAWNAAGHRLVAAIAWQQLSPASRTFVADALAAHPDHDRWLAKARTADPADIFAEASTWPDDIRNDPRFHDAGLDDATPPLPGFPDTARHKNWHYVDVDGRGQTKKGEVDRQIERLGHLLHPKGTSYGARSTRKNDEISYALPWLLHLVADIHQPLHVGHADDDGGNTVDIENPFNTRLPFVSLHTYWDDLPGPPWLRGQRLEKRVQRLSADHPAPLHGDVALWRDESHRLLPATYPDTVGNLLPVVSETFNRQAHAIADRRIVDAGYRLGWLLETSISARVSRETQ
jgi:hypothetical protein